MFRTIFIFILSIPCLFSATRIDPPLVIDLKEKVAEFELSGVYAFNKAPEIGVFLAYLKRLYQIDITFETGTYTGNTTAFLAICFEQVHTVEIDSEKYQKSKELLKFYPNVQCHLGSSEEILNEILPGLKDQPILFYLDAHWNEYWPLLDELRAISKTHRDNCIIVIDDFKVPHRNDIPYDHYGSHECSYEYIQSALNEVFTDYASYYLIPKNVFSAAKFIAIPKNWGGLMDVNDIPMW